MGISRIIRLNHLGVAIIETEVSPPSICWLAKDRICQLDFPFTKII
jgi:hypothetical protein